LQENLSADLFLLVFVGKGVPWLCSRSLQRQVKVAEWLLLLQLPFFEKAMMFLMSRMTTL